jgi:hypothetical protein
VGTAGVYGGGALRAAHPVTALFAPPPPPLPRLLPCRSPTGRLRAAPSASRPQAAPPRLRRPPPPAPTSAATSTRRRSLQTRCSTRSRWSASSKPAARTRARMAEGVAGVAVVATPTQNHYPWQHPSLACATCVFGASQLDRTHKSLEVNFADLCVCTQRTGARTLLTSTAAASAATARATRRPSAAAAGATPGRRRRRHPPPPGRSPGW